VSSEPQQVSAALASGVNPGGAGTAEGMAGELGFDLIQGFLFAKPMGVQTFMRAIGPSPATVV
jgi:c-di-GMP-related signal transduction protein